MQSSSSNYSHFRNPEFNNHEQNLDKQQVLEIKFNYHVIFIIGLHYHLGTSLQMLKAMMSNWRYMCFMSPSEREKLQI